jgi:hypothetical protein
MNHGIDRSRIKWIPSDQERMKGKDAAQKVIGDKLLDIIINRLVRAKLVNIIAGYGYAPVLAPMASCVRSATAGRIQR